MMSGVTVVASVAVDSLNARPAVRSIVPSPAD